MCMETLEYIIEWFNKEAPPSLSFIPYHGWLLLLMICVDIIQMIIWYNHHENGREIFLKYDFISHMEIFK